LEDTALTYTIPAFTTDTSCQTFSYWLYDSTLNWPDSSVFAFTSSTRELVVYTTDASFVGTHSFIIYGSLDLSYEYAYSTSFSVTIGPSCSTTVISGTGISNYLYDIAGGLTEVMATLSWT
jgi:hypothetical protein